VGGGRTMDTTEFFALLAPSAPAALSRALGQSFIVGKQSLIENQLILVFDIANFENAFAAILQWEQQMLSDLMPLFRAMNPSNNIDLSETIVFQDEILENLDARVAKNKLGDIIMLYAFYGQDTLIITSHEDTLKEILFRMTAFRKIR
jgi:hypothetical protein